MNTEKYCMIISSSLSIKQEHNVVFKCIFMFSLISHHVNNIKKHKMHTVLH